MEQNTTVATSERTMAASASFIAGSVLLIIALFVGGFYMMNAGVSDDAMPDAGIANTQPAVGSSDEIAATESETAAATAAFTTQSSSDEMSSIEADLSATDMNSLGDIDQI